ncbi:hypothetical protein LTR08_000389 [Meristemomyces frigidus]|nr:hypothetical protein LTR08_000389 [Meristemomyces frigidus]
MVDTLPAFDFGVSLKRLLHYTTNLEIIRINFDPEQTLAQDLIAWLGESAVPSALPTKISDVIIPSIAPNLTGLDLGMMNVSNPTLVRAIAKFDLKSLNLWKVSLRSNEPANYPEYPNRWACFLQTLSEALPVTNRLTAVLVGYPSQCYYPPRPLPMVEVPNARIHFAADGNRDNQSQVNLLDKASYRATYGSNVKQWLLDTAKTTLIITESDGDYESYADDDDGDDDGDDDEDDLEEMGLDDSDSDFEDEDDGSLVLMTGFSSLQ